MKTVGKNWDEDRLAQLVDAVEFGSLVGKGVLGIRYFNIMFGGFLMAIVVSADMIFVIFVFLYSIALFVSCTIHYQPTE